MVTPLLPYCVFFPHAHFFMDIATNILEKIKMLNELRERYKKTTEHYQKEFIRMDGIKLKKEINCLTLDYIKQVRNSINDQFINLVVIYLF